jgi:flagellar motility protein MotE (MotC chaperone)
VFKLIAFAFTLAAGGGTTEPTPPTPPAGPTAPKDPEAPAPKGEGAKTGEGKSADKSPEAPKGEKASEKPAAAKPAEKPAAEAAEKPAGKPEKRSAAKPGRGTVAPPPSLTGSALRQEIKQNGGEERGAAPLSERARLEQLASEITRAREALKQDTARLESMLKNGGDGRMPYGDPTEPVASPGGPAASKEAMKEQILTVSKAMKGMKPEQAAAIISRLDRVLASEILRRMKPADAGAVMASIKPELAAELATAIATRKSMVDADPKGVRK